jgi:hypothetical protein
VGNHVHSLRFFYVARSYARFASSVRSCAHHIHEADADRHALRQAVIVPYGAERQPLQLLQQRQPAGHVAVAFQCSHLANRMGQVCTPPAKRIVPVWSHEQLEGEGPLRWRRRLRREKRDKAIVFY